MAILTEVHLFLKVVELGSLIGRCLLRELRTRASQYEMTHSPPGFGLLLFLSPQLGLPNNLI